MLLLLALNLAKYDVLLLPVSILCKAFCCNGFHCFYRQNPPIAKRNARRAVAEFFFCGVCFYSDGIGIIFNNLKEEEI